MRKINNSYSQEYLREYEDTREFIEGGEYVIRHADDDNALNGLKCASLKERGDGWGGTNSLQEAVYLARNGWGEGRDKIRDLVVQVKNQELVDMAMRRLPVYDVAGDEADIDRYLAGEPEHMFTLVEQLDSQRGKVIRILANRGASCNVNRSRIERYGAAMLLLVETLIKLGYSVEVSICFNSFLGVGFYEVHIPIMAAGSPINGDTLAFWMVQPAVQRRLAFANRECESVKLRNRFGFHDPAGYGYSGESQFTEGFDLVLKQGVVNNFRDDCMILPKVHGWLRELGIEREDAA